MSITLDITNGRRVGSLEKAEALGDGDTLLASMADGSGEKLASMGVVRGYVTDGILTEYNNAGSHNSIFRGKNLGAKVTDKQQTAIESGSFDGLYIGDYWEIGGVKYRIAAFDYWYGMGDTPCQRHHALLVPDDILYTAQMRNTPSGQYETGEANTTEGGYVGSDMYKTGLARAKATVRAAFGEAHVLSHREYLTNAATNGHATSGAWYDSDVELMDEPMVYGSHIFAPGTGIGSTDSVIPHNYSIDNAQLPLFAMDHGKICNRASWWLRVVVSAVCFADVGGLGDAGCGSATNPYGVRPVFAVC